jgi:hypothetical protein
MSHLARWQHRIGFQLCCFFINQLFARVPAPCISLLLRFHNFFTFNFAVFIRKLEYDYNIQTVNSFVSFSKIRYYLFYVFVGNSRYNIIMDSIDRYTSAPLAAPCFIIWRHDMTKAKKISLGKNKTRVMRAGADGCLSKRTKRVIMTTLCVCLLWKEKFRRVSSRDILKLVENWRK